MAVLEICCVCLPEYSVHIPGRGTLQEIQMCSVSFMLHGTASDLLKVSHIQNRF